MANRLLIVFVILTSYFSVAFSLNGYQFFESYAEAQSDERSSDEMRVKLEFDLCPEYKLGNVQIKPYYKIDESSEPILPTIVSESIDTDNNKYLTTIELPRSLGTKKLIVYGKCQSINGTSKDSNNLKVSNCDLLATLDSDNDGMTDEAEDTNCDNSFSPGDTSNLNNVDTDGDGVRDLVEASSGTDSSDPGSSPRPMIFSAASFDPDNNTVSNPVIFRSNIGTWYIKSDLDSDQNQSFVFGAEKDLPFTYRDNNQNSNVGVIRKNGLALNWFFRGKGFSTTTGDLNSVSFGIFGDNIILGAWEKPGVTNPAVARLYNGIWYFSILLSDLTVKNITWGGNGDIPKPQDLDGDKIFDISVFRPSTGRTYSILSRTGGVLTNFFGNGTSDHTVKGDYTGDGIEEISFWEPQSAKFYSMKSDITFDSTKANQKDLFYYQELNLGEYFYDLPLSWNQSGNLNLYSVINHSTGIRKFYLLNNPNTPVKTIQWGISGDHQG